MALTRVVLQSLSRHTSALKACTLVLCLLPAMQLLWEWKSQQLGINPLERLQRFTGYWAYLLLLITLTITPTRQCMPWLARAWRWAWGKRMVDWNWLLRIRRMLGVSAFCYGALHCGIYMALDQTWDWSGMWHDAADRRFVLAGWLSLLFMLPLALTSTDGMVRRLGRHWKRIHRLVYLVALLAATHYVWLTKAGVWVPWLYALAMVTLVALRLVFMRLPLPKVHADADSHRTSAADRQSV